MGLLSSKHVPENRKCTKIGPLTPEKAKEEDAERLDPRSPNLYIFRTPIVSPGKKSPSITKNQDLTKIDDTPTKNTVYKDRLLKNLNQDPLDPRSPTQHILRTPLILKDEETPTAANITVPSVEYTEIFEDCHCFVDDHLDQISIDPRSPSLDIQRTPLVLDEQDEEQGEEIVEKIEVKTEILIVNKWIENLKDVKIDPRSPSVEIERTPIVLAEETEPKSAEIVKLVEEDKVEVEENRTVVKPTKLVNKVEKEVTTKIYNDIENVKYSTPKRLAALAEVGHQRTPLGCVANKENGSKLRQKPSRPSGILKFQSMNANDENNTNKTPKLQVFNDENNFHVSAKSASLSSGGKSRIPVFRSK